MVVFKRKPPASRARRSRPMRKRKPYKKRPLTAQGVKRIALSVANQGREIKRTYGQIVIDANNNQVMVPTGTLVPFFQFSEGSTQYTEACLNATRQGIESELRIGNSVQPISFNMRGYGVIGNNTTANANIYQTHCRLVVGFRRQNTVLSPSNNNILIEAGKQCPLRNDYSDIMASFNWKEFRPFYDKIFKIAP